MTKTKTKTIQLNKPIKTIFGQQATFGILDETPGGVPKPLFVKGVLLELLPMANRRGKEAVQCWDLAIKIKNAETNIEIEDEDFGLLKKVVEENSSGRNPMTGESISAFKLFVIAQILKDFEELER